MLDVALYLLQHIVLVLDLEHKLSSLVHFLDILPSVFLKHLKHVDDFIFKLLRLINHLLRNTLHHHLLQVIKPFQKLPAQLTNLNDKCAHLQVVFKEKNFDFVALSLELLQDLFILLNSHFRCLPLLLEGPFVF